MRRTVGGLVACWLPIVRKRDSTQDGRTVQQWCNWLHEKKKKKDEKKRRTEEHQKVGDPMRSSVQGRPGFLHRITKPATWR